MRRIRYLSLLMLLLGSIGMWAQSDFNPGNPAEPGEPPMKLTLVASPSEGGSVYGGGKYAPGTSVSLRASSRTGFVFAKWTNAAGEVVSTASSFSYTKGRGNETLTAHFDFSPGSPGEPTEIAQSVFYWLTLAAESGGRVSGGGRYKAGTMVTVRATPESQHVFAGWYDGEGRKLSADVNYQYTMTTESVTLTARFRFDPSSPSEPSEPTVKPMHNLKVTATDGGTVNLASSRLHEGESVMLRATCNSGYEFAGWYVNGELHTALKEFSYTMGTSDIEFEARFTFNPSNPSDPNTPSSKNYSFYLMNKVTKPGQTVVFPVYLMSLNELKDMTFQLTFAKELHPDMASVQLSAKAEGYELSYSAPTDTTYVVTLLGGSMRSGNSVLLSITVPIPEEMATAKGYPVKINQVSVTESDGTTVTASTRNGRISVYKNGDSNGDDDVNIVDVTSTIGSILGEPPAVFITEAADANDDAEINIVDVTSIIDIILGDGNAGARPVRILDPQ